jgi:hypothetical protein
VTEQYKQGLLPPDFFSRDNRWFWRGKEYRELAEPLDIANWYMKNKHWEYKEMYDCVEEGYHYAQGINTNVDELTVDNDRRALRYRLLQRMEVVALGSAASSMGLARKLQAQLGNRKWQEVLGATGERMLCGPCTGPSGRLVAVMLLCIVMLVLLAWQVASFQQRLAQERHLSTT